MPAPRALELTDIHHNLALVHRRLARSNRLARGAASMSLEMGAFIRASSKAPPRQWK
ncbi:hypothetical protein SJ05684_c35060 [Sinorhizobium sojae CCBAU 05684]|uniref:Uncharacterized protein n=1 Tax=Sinorhizobium sojae CCBAU 05684 TaxID=716928 RepID=A0A249PGS0_9HYPH|nr:hypothetical protein SJ05684_c35060 [Sinorhizobium sojae CCBAU 05684]